MHQIRLFKNVESDIREMEKDINDWLKKSNARVIHVCGNIAPQSSKEPATIAGKKQFGASDVLVAVVYEA